jgi:Flp pilus assembly protein TadB
MSTREAGRAAAGFRRIRRVASWVIPFAAFVVILLVLRGAGVPLSVPGVVVVLLLLGVVRVTLGRARRRRRARAVTAPNRTR